MSRRIGTPPSGLGTAVRGAVATQLASARGLSPCARRLRPAAIAGRIPRSRSVPGDCSSSNKCVGDKPESPAAEARGNFRAARRISGGVKDITASSGGISIMPERSKSPSVAGGVWGCFMARVRLISSVGVCTPGASSACGAFA